MTAEENAGETVAPDQDWDYGGYRYGLEPLFLPPSTDAARAQQTPPMLVGTVEAADAGSPASACDTGRAAPDLDVMDDIFWFRWITGHQITFVLWHLMGRALRSGTPAEGLPGEEVITALACLTDGYNAMLLYTSSCTPEAYSRFIRPAMYRQHHGFSGGWAPDYARVRQMFSGRQPEWIKSPETKRLRDALRVNHAVHKAVAARLAPGSQSLLQRFAPAARTQDRSTHAVIFDNFFLTIRREISDEHLYEQLACRLRAVLLDIGRNRFHLGGRPTTPDGAPSEYDALFIRECEPRFHSIAARLMPVAQANV